MQRAGHQIGAVAGELQLCFILVTNGLLASPTLVCFVGLCEEGVLHKDHSSIHSLSLNEPSNVTEERLEEWATTSKIKWWNCNANWS